MSESITGIGKETLTLPVTINDRYRAQKRIAIGNHAEVLQAIDLQFSDDKETRFVAIKLMYEGVPGDYEARLGRDVRHEAVASVYDWATYEGRDFVVYELVVGPTLQDLGGKCSLEEACQLVSKIARGVDVAHRQGIVHADLKPDNVAMTEDGPKVLDFGSAVRPGCDAACSRGFGAPEQREYGAGFESDVYALGGLLHWLVMGTIPNEHGPIKADPILQRIRDRAMREDPRARYALAGFLADDLDSWLKREPISWTSPGFRRVPMFVRRHRLASALTALALVALMSGAVWEGRNWRVQRLLDESTEIQAENAAAFLGFLNKQPAAKSSTGVDPLAGLIAWQLRHSYQDLDTIRRRIDAILTCARAERAVMENQGQEAMARYADLLAEFDADLATLEPGSSIHCSVLSARFILAHPRHLDRPQEFRELQIRIPKILMGTIKSD